MITNKGELNQFNEEYLKYTAQVAESCQDRDLSENSIVIGTSAIIDTEIDGAVGMNSGIFNNPFIIWGRYRKKWFRYMKKKEKLHPLMREENISAGEVLF